MKNSTPKNSTPKNSTPASANMAQLQARAKELRLAGLLSVVT